MLTRCPIYDIDPVISLGKLGGKPGSQAHKAEIGIPKWHGAHQGQFFPVDVEFRDVEAIGGNMGFQSGFRQGIVDESEVKEIGMNVKAAR